MSRPRVRTAILLLLSGPLWVGGLALWGSQLAVPGAETNAAPAADAAPKDGPSLQQLLKICAGLQEQLRATQHALEEARAEAKSSAKITADTTAERLKLLDQTLGSLRQQFEGQVSAYANTNAELARQLNKSLEAGAALQRTVDQLEARLQALSNELAQTRTNLTNETARRKQLEGRDIAAAGTIAELTNQLARSRENEAALRQAREELDKQSQQAGRQLTQALADQQKALAARQQAEQQSVTLAQSNAVLSRVLEQAKAAGAAQEKAREQVEQRLTAMAAELGQVKGALQEETARRRVLEQQAGNLLATNVDLTLQLVRRLEAEVGLRTAQEKLERPEEATRQFMESRSLMQQAQNHLEERARQADATLGSVREDLNQEKDKSRRGQEAAQRRELVGLGLFLLLMLAMAALFWVRLRQLRRPMVPARETGPESRRVARFQPEATSAQAATHPATPAGVIDPGYSARATSVPVPSHPTTAIAATGGRGQGEGPSPRSAEHEKATSEAVVPPEAGTKAPIEGLIRKGLSLLNASQAEAALTCFDEALALDPSNGETLVKRGTALERLQRTEEAISSYERAIRLDESLTMAYLLKGAALIRLNRHEEAAECYRLAVTARRAQAAPPAAEDQSSKP
jgi:tetratricopeptide (TPR) repeat protein